MTEGIEHHVANRLDKAAERYARVVKLLPGHGDAWRLLGVVALQRGDPAARSMLNRAIRIDPNDAAAHSALGSVNESEGKLDLAYAAYETARALDISQDAASVGLTRVALGLGRPAEAVAVGEATLARGTVDASLLRAVGGARLLLRDYAGAADALEASLRIKPHVDAYAYLAGAYLFLHRVDAAIAASEHALMLDASHVKATLHLGIGRYAQGAFPAALEAFERAVELGSEEAHLNVGTLRLLLGDYRNGWLHFGWMTAKRRANPVSDALPVWDGGLAREKRLLVWHEQGVGDTIQLARFLHDARARVGSLTLACPPETADLFCTIEGVDAVVDMNLPLRFDSFDIWLPTVQLPYVLDVTQETIRAAQYVQADSERIERYRPQLDTPGTLRVGLVWSGNPEFAWNDTRSCGLRELERLNDVPGVTWFALQHGPARDDKARNGMQIVPINKDVSDFADTAAIISQLDLVITVDTSVAHLAGALGRPVWVLLGDQPDWRWQLAGDVSSWYPTLRLFRKSNHGSWSATVAAAAAELREFATGLEHRSHDL